MGVQLGGFEFFLCGFKIPEIFGKAGVFSPSFGSPSLYPDGTIKKRQKQNLFSLR
jgi:hypothetical protein